VDNNVDNSSSSVDDSSVDFETELKVSLPCEEDHQTLDYISGNKEIKVIVDEVLLASVRSTCNEIGKALSTSI